MAAVQTLILAALSARVGTEIEGYPVTWGFRSFTPPAVGGKPAPYVIAANISNTPQRLTIGSDDPDNRQGILTLSLMYPVALDHDLPVILEQAALIAAVFPKDLIMHHAGARVRVTQSPRVVEPYRDDAYFRCPVSMQWQAFI